MTAHYVEADKIVLISLDTVRGDVLSTAPRALWPHKYPGLARPATPALDHLVSRGTYFPEVLSAAPYTSASHAAWFTGVWPVRNGVYEFFHRPLQSRTLFTEARRRGYRTVFKVDFPLILGPHLGFDRDIDHYIVEDDDAALAALTGTDRTLSLVHFGSAHIPYGFHNVRYGGDAYRRKLDELEAGLDSAYAGGLDTLVETYRDAEDLGLLLRYKRVIQYLMEQRDYHRLFQLYLEGIETFCRTRLDAFLDRLHTALAGQRYLLVVFADHGEEYDAVSYGHHNTVTEGVLRVPLILEGPDVPAMTRRERVRSVDLVPTLLDALGWRDHQLGELDGASLADAIWRGNPIPPRPAFAQAWTSDTAEFVGFQRELLATGRHPGYLHHACCSEVVYLDGHRLTRRHIRYAGGGGVWGMERANTTERLEREGPMGWEDIDDPRAHRAASDALAAYDHLRTLGPGGPAVPVDPSVREHLRAMGYRI